MKTLLLATLATGALLIGTTDTASADHFRSRGRSGFGISLNLGRGTSISYSRGYVSPYRSYGFTRGGLPGYTTGGFGGYGRSYYYGAPVYYGSPVYNRSFGRSYSRCR